MEKININELEEFIEENKAGEMTIQDVEKDVIRLKRLILVKVEQQLNIEFERGNSAMVAAIAEILKAFS